MRELLYFLLLLAALTNLGWSLVQIAAWAETAHRKPKRCLCAKRTFASAWERAARAEWLYGRCSSSKAYWCARCSSYHVETIVRIPTRSFSE